MCGSCGGRGSGNCDTFLSSSGRTPKRCSMCPCPMPISCHDVMRSRLWDGAPALWPCNPCFTEPERNCYRKRFVPWPTCDCSGPPPTCCTGPSCTPWCGGSNMRG